MIVGRRGIVYFLALLTLSGFANAVESDYRFVSGTLDDFSKNSIVISDQAFSVSSLVTCYDRSGKTLVGCSGLKGARWVEVSIDWESDEVIKIRRLNKSDLPRILDND
ncbi:hypothetical protein [Litoribrevibacter albus]|uniref:Uncharacterized protein n=1 Tax=Litoribrevibacter albus TaxID=1473156 RepID=A0AA37SGF1_9GAMM|nr:hypothetical protein [Litoribrevibacter albus]GLQ33679.1 hypothetical protein GCM10007876_41590 [Litoribrevibacter albus]